MGISEGALFLFCPVSTLLRILFAVPDTLYVDFSLSISEASVDAIDIKNHERIINEVQIGLVKRIFSEFIYRKRPID